MHAKRRKGCRKPHQILKTKENSTRKEVVGRQNSVTEKMYVESEIKFIFACTTLSTPLFQERVPQPCQRSYVC